MSLLAEVEALLAQVQAYALDSAQALEEYKRTITGRKGAIVALFSQFKAVPSDQKAAFGKALNELKQLAEAREAEARAALKSKNALKDQPADLSLPGQQAHAGSRHPLAVIQRRIFDIFEGIGFDIYTGPEIEDDWHNFTALNFPKNHPARDMQDTFFVGRQPDKVLRTHTTNLQIRAMEERKPPFRIIMPGRVYRNEAISARAHCFFHQIDGLVVDEGISFADMRQTMQYFVKQFYGPDVAIRFRPSYFPFTEISAEMDISCTICGGKGCRVCKYTGWLEILGCGMVDPNVLENCGIDPDRYSGYAWGMGLERPAMLLHRVPDLRLYSQNDVRFLRQFQQL